MPALQAGHHSQPRDTATQSALAQANGTPPAQLSPSVSLADAVCSPELLPAEYFRLP